MSSELQMRFVMDEGREELEAERHWKSKVRKRRVEKGRSRSSEEKEQGSGLITETDGDRKTKCG